MNHTPILAVIFLALIALSLPGPVAAQTGSCNYALDQATLNRCADQEYKDADARLNQTYRALTRQLGADSKARLLKSQRAWIAYKEATCEFEGAPSRGGSINAMVVSDCLTRITRNQTAILERHLYCEEGDLSCVRN